MYVLIVGTMFGPKTIHGPFEDWDMVNQWASIHVKNQHYEIVKLEDMGIQICHRPQDHHM